MVKYRPLEIEPKWQKKWAQDGLYKAIDGSPKPKFYCLDMFPYPSGDGLHVGHFKGYTATDIISRYLRMKGYNVLHPIGWDAFGLPAENYAIKTGVHPAIVTQKAIAKIKKQIQAAGFSYDWSREINTTDPNYYRWTQWIFLRIFEMGLAYEAVVPINFCPSCKTGLANEEVVGGKCERCGHQVIRKDLRQWLLKITAYADRLLEDLEGLDWPESIIQMQKNWIGKSNGAIIEFSLEQLPLSIEVFTTRCDTLFGASYLVLAPEHQIIESLKPAVKNWPEVEKYVNFAKQKSDLERQEAKEKTGVRLEGLTAINPVNGAKLPVFVADYVLAHYGTGAIMAVPAHDKRDFEFAKAFNLPIIEVIKGEQVQLPYEGEGILVNSAQFTGLPSPKARLEIVKALEKQGKGRLAVSYKLRDWVFSRQRYWGEPIPLVFCPRCAQKIKSRPGEDAKEFSKGELLNPGWIAVPDKDLPVVLPKVASYKPTGTGESPLAGIKDWLETTCPKCGGPAKRESNTMPQWAGSCWYYLRYLDPQNRKAPFSPDKERYWMGAQQGGKGGVDWYVGGAEHAVLHLLYARFWHKVLYDLGLVSTLEPFAKLRNVGLVLAEGGVKMSKSKGNVVSPDEICQIYGADTLRVYELFMGPFNQSIAWDSSSVEGVYRFLGRVWQLVNESANNTGEVGKELATALNGLIKKVEEDIANMHFNTAIAAMMEFVNLAFKQKGQFSKNAALKFVLILAPFAPHLAEELWQILGQAYSIHQQSWPVYEESLLESAPITVVVQVNGKLRGKLAVKRGQSEEALKEAAFALEKVKKHLANQTVAKVIVVPDRLVNIVTGDER